MLQSQNCVLRLIQSGQIARCLQRALGGLYRGPTRAEESRVLGIAVPRAADRSSAAVLRTGRMRHRRIRVCGCEVPGKLDSLGLVTPALALTPTVIILGLCSGGGGQLALLVEQKQGGAAQSDGITAGSILVATLNVHVCVVVVVLCFCEGTPKGTLLLIPDTGTSHKRIGPNAKCPYRDITIFYSVQLPEHRDIEGVKGLK
jgi:hypothetical protein